MTTRILLLLPLVAALGACSALDRNRNTSEREWARAECDRIIDREARERCLRRLDDDYGSTETKKPQDPKARK